MTKQRKHDAYQTNQDSRAEPGQAGAEPEQTDPTAEEPDFAAEHTNVTFAYQLEGGPEGIPESEAPEGYAGLESRGLGRRGRSDDT